MQQESGDSLIECDETVAEGPRPGTTKLFRLGVLLMR